MSIPALRSHAFVRSTLTIHRDELDLARLERGGTIAVRTTMLCAVGQRTVLLVYDDDGLLGEIDVAVLRRDAGVVVVGVDSSPEDLAVLRAATTTLPTLDAPFADLRDAAAELSALARQRQAIVPVLVPARARTEVLVRIVGPDGRTFASFPGVVRYCIARDGARFAAIAVSAGQSGQLAELASELRAELIHERSLPGENDAHPSRR